MASGSHEAVEEMADERKGQFTVPVEEEEEEQMFAVRVGECVSIVLTRGLPWGEGGAGELAAWPPALLENELSNAPELPQQGPEQSSDIGERLDMTAQLPF